MKLTIENVYDISQEIFESELQRYSDLYYNEEPEITDEIYDNFLDIYLERFGKEYKIVGAQTKNKVKLPYWMGSLDKIKDNQENKLERWKSKYSSKNFIVTEKLDGISALYSYPNLYTRGDGKEGTDISWLIPYLNLPSEKPAKSLVIRGEIIMNKKVFDDKYSSSFANARNMVSGIVNSKHINDEDVLSLLEFIAYEIIYPFDLSPLEQIKKLKESNFKIVKYKIFDKDSLSLSNLSDYLKYSKENSVYEIDGIVIYSNSYYPRIEGKNPGNVIAYKSQGDIATTTVIEVEWNVSKHSVLKPRIRIEPVSLSGVTIRYTTGFNAKYINDNDIGPGSVIRITRSGDVIPHIVEVVSSTKASFPEDKIWRWDNNFINIVAKEDDTVRLKKISFFFSEIGVKTLGEKTLSKLVSSGYDSIDKIIRIKKEDIQNKIPGIGPKTAVNIVDGISSVLKDIPLSRLMSATQIFGFGIGEKKCRLITDEYPNIIEIYKKNSKQALIKITSIKGFSSDSAKEFIKNLPLFISFLERNSEYIKIKKDKAPSSTPSSNLLSQKKIVFSGFRDKDLERLLTEKGSKITSAVSSVTNILIVKDKNEISKKINDARVHCIPILTIEEFKKQYLD